MPYRVTIPRKMAIQERRLNILRMLRKKPGITYEQVGKKLGISKETVQQDMVNFSKDMEMQSKSDYASHKIRILQEIHMAKLECDKRLLDCKSPTQGSRWLEEKTKLINLECRVLSIFDPSKIGFNDDANTIRMTKHERDAIVHAAVSEDDIIMKSANPREAYNKKLPMIIQSTESTE